MTKKRKRRNPSKYPVVGKYIDTPTKTEINVIYFMDDAGDYKFTLGDWPQTILKGCRIQFKSVDVKRKRKFYKELQHFINFSSGWQGLNQPQTQPLPLLFGLLKLRKNKQRKFVLVQSADQYTGGRVINVIAVGIDNLLYMDLVSKLKAKP
jgi:hypothetical protein